MDETTSDLTPPDGPALFGAAELPKSSPASTSNAGYRVLARKYRPRDFDDLIGQEPMVRTLSNAFDSGRIAQAYMLTGVRGVGKTTTARILSRGLNYELPGKANKPTIHMPELGLHCQAIIDGRHVDVIEMDAASHNGVDNIREITDAARYKPVSARMKIYLLDEVHMLTTAAFNALLKTLEEPPEHVKFIFATTEIRKVPVTILSRCQRFDLRRIETEVLVRHLARIAAAEQVTIDDEALKLIARAAEGSVRDSLSLMDQAIAHGAGDVTAERVRDMLGLADRGRVIDLFEQVMRADMAAALGELKAQYDIGADPAVVLADLAEFTHFVTRLKLVPDAARDAAATEAERVRGSDFAGKLGMRALTRAWQILLKGIDEVKTAPRPLAAAEMVLVRLAYAADLPTPDELIRALQSGAPTSGGGGGGRAPSGGGGPGGAQMNATGAAATADGRGGGATMGGGFAPRLVAGLNGGAGGATARAEPVAPAATPSPQAAGLRTLDDIADFCGKQRDFRLKVMVERGLRPVRLEPGRIEVALAPEAARDLPGDLGRKLTEWTGMRWIVSVSREPGGPTIAEAREAVRATNMTDARSDPLVSAVLRRFPGSEIVDVRIQRAEIEAAESETEDDSGYAGFSPLEPPSEADDD